MDDHSQNRRPPPEWADTTPPPDGHVIRVPGYEGKDRRDGYSQWRRDVHDRLNDGSEKMDLLRADVDANTKATNQVKADTSEILEIFRALKGALTVLDWIGKLAKPIGAIVMVCAAAASFWSALKGGKT